MPWRVERVRGPAGRLHLESAELAGSPVGRTVRVLEAERQALVLGSGQGDALFDPARVRAHRLEVARRRSGGGAVLVGPGKVLWVDVVVPAGDPLWEPDVVRSAFWLGEVWAGALNAAGVFGARVWTGRMRPLCGSWSTRVCFANLGPGEVLVGGQKVVGISQRRTRWAALFQTAALLQWDPQVMSDLLGGGAEEQSCLRRVARGLGAESAHRLLNGLLDGLEGL